MFELYISNINITLKLIHIFTSKGNIKHPVFAHLLLCKQRYRSCSDKTSTSTDYRGIVPNNRFSQKRGHSLAQWHNINLQMYRWGQWPLGRFPRSHNKSSPKWSLLHCLFHYSTEFESPGKLFIQYWVASMS